MRKSVKVIVDRPIGYRDAYGNQYPINYGYVPGTVAGDGEEQDVYILGVTKPIKIFEGEVIAVIYRKDDVEDKWVVSNGKDYSKEEIWRSVSFNEKYFDSYIELK